MKPDQVPVLLVVAEGTPTDSLAPAAELLGRFGVPFREGGSPGQIPGLRLVVVASSEQRTPSLWAQSGVPTVRVPVAAGPEASAAERLALLVPPDGQETGVGFATLAVGVPGARNAALFAVAVLAAQGDEALAGKLAEFRREQAETVRRQTVSL